MSIRTRPPFRADHVGRLLRPAELHAARDDFAAGRIDALELRRVLAAVYLAADARRAGLDELAT